MITIEASPLAGHRGEFDVVEVAHLHCRGCGEQAHYAATHACATGSVGATSSIGGDVLPEAAHGARVVRARCNLPRSFAKGGDCCCPICLAVPGHPWAGAAR